jgi:hypothetical protein
LAPGAGSRGKTFRIWQLGIGELDGPVVSRVIPEPGDFGWQQNALPDKTVSKHAASAIEVKGFMRVLFAFVSLCVRQPAMITVECGSLPGTPT